MAGNSQGSGNDYQLIGGILHNGARDSDGGLWIRIRDLTDHRILKAAVEKALKNKESADNTIGSLDPEAPGRITYIEDALNRLKQAIIGALPASEQLAGTPIGDAISKNASQVAQPALPLPDELEPEDSELADKALFEQLADIGADLQGGLAFTWTPEERREVYRWARAVQLTRGGARRDLHVPARPAQVPLEWFGQEIKAAIEKGTVDEETLAPIVLDDAQVDYWLQQGPWRVAEYSRDESVEGGEQKAPALEFAIEWGEMVEMGEGATKPPTHPYVYDSKTEASLIAAQMNRRSRLNEGIDNDPIIEGEPLPFNESLLTIELQTSIIQDLNDTLRASGDSKTIIDKEPLALGAIRKWIRTGPYVVHRVDDTVKTMLAGTVDPNEVKTEEARYRIAKQIAPGKFIGAISSYDIYEAHVRAALMNRAEFQTGQLWGDGNEAEKAVTAGKKKRGEKGKGGGKKRGGK